MGVVATPGTATTLSCRGRRAYHDTLESHGSRPTEGGAGPWRCQLCRRSRRCLYPISRKSPPRSAAAPAAETPAADRTGAPAPASEPLPSPRNEAARRVTPVSPGGRCNTSMAGLGTWRPTQQPCRAGAGMGRGGRTHLASTARANTLRGSAPTGLRGSDGHRRRRRRWLRGRHRGARAPHSSINGLRRRRRSGAESHGTGGGCCEEQWRRARGRLGGGCRRAHGLAHREPLRPRDGDCARSGGRDARDRRPEGGRPPADSIGGGAA